MGNRALLDTTADAGQGLGMTRLLSDEEITRQLGDLPGWRLSTHSAGGLTQLDIELAHRISQAAARLNATAKVTS